MSTRAPWPCLRVTSHRASGGKPSSFFKNDAGLTHLLVSTTFYFPEQSSGNLHLDNLWFFEKTKSWEKNCLVSYIFVHFKNKVTKTGQFINTSNKSLVCYPDWRDAELTPLPYVINQVRKLNNNTDPQRKNAAKNAFYWKVFKTTLSPS